MRKSEKGPTTIRASTHHLQRPFVITNVSSTQFPLQMPQTGSHKANENLRQVQALGIRILRVTGGQREAGFAK